MATETMWKHAELVEQLEACRDRAEDIPVKNLFASAVRALREYEHLDQVERDEGCEHCCKHCSCDRCCWCGV